MGHTRTNPAKFAAMTALTMAALALLPAAGCRGDRSEKPPRQFLPDMDDSPKFKPQAGTDFFADGRSMRAPEAGTVAFGAFAFAAETLPDGSAWAAPFLQERADLLADDAAAFTGLNPDGTPVAKMPMPVTPDLLARGQERFNIYCSACHGYAGDGNGMVGRRWSAPVPSFHDAKYKDPSQPTAGDGYLFHVARHGLKHPDGRYRMPAYGHALSVEDTWAVIAHVRVLQQALDNDPQSLPAEARSQLDARGRSSQGGSQ